MCQVNPLKASFFVLTKNNDKIMVYYQKHLRSFKIITIPYNKLITLSSTFSENLSDQHIAHQISF